MNKVPFLSLCAVVVLAGCSDVAQPIAEIGDIVEAPPVAVTKVVTVSNVSDTQPLAPGVFVVHTGEASLNFEGTQVPASLEPLAEIGSHMDFAAYVRTLPGVLDVYTIDMPIHSGESEGFTITVPTQNAYLSGVMMAVGTNDGYALIDSASLTSTAVVSAENHDAGTEENSPLLSGFAGGQPDPAQGEANIENGTATVPQAIDTIHPQLTETVMQVQIVQ